MEKKEYIPYQSMLSEKKIGLLTNYYKQLENAIVSLNKEDVQKALDMIEQAYMNRKKMYIIGNG
jgi:phosphoheptose isomerase